MRRVAALLHQHRHWVDALGQRHRLRNMDPHWRANLIPFLRGNARTLYALDHGIPVDERDQIDPQTAEEWIADTKLMRRLVDLEHGRTFDDRRTTFERNQNHEQATGYRKVRFG